MKPRKMRRRLMGLSIFAVMGVSLFSAGANAFTIKAAEAEVAINETNFPDGTFRKEVKKFDTDKNGSFSSTELQAVTAIDVSGTYSKPGDIANLKGIEYFTAIRDLSCYNNQLTSLDVSSNTALIKLDCENNQLKSLDVSNNTVLEELRCNDNQLTRLEISGSTALTKLYCINNRLTNLDVSNNTALKDLRCNDNQLTSLVVSNNTALRDLACVHNQLKSLDVSNNTALEGLYCNDNQLTSLDISKNTALTSLNCGNNQLKSLDVSNNTALFMLYCNDNQLTSLNVNSNTDLLEFKCGNNQLKSLDVSRNTALQYLYCNDNQLKSLDVNSNTALIYLYCQDNQLKSLDVNSNTALIYLYCQDNQLPSLDVSRNTALTQLYCNDNQLSSLDVSRNTALVYLYCNDNRLPSLDVSNNTALYALGCGVNKLTNLDVSRNTALKALGCSDNQLASLDVSNNTALTTLSCGNNQLASLDVSNNTALTTLSCGNNQLASLDVSNNTALTTLNCENNRLPSLDVSKNTALKNLSCDGNTHSVLLSTDNTFDMATLPGMCVSNVSIITGGTIKGNILTVDSNAETVTYIYDCGNGKTSEFKLTIISSSAVTLSNSGYTYTGSAITPAVTVTYGGKNLVAGTDYTVKYINNKDAGTASVTITGKGNYTGKVTKNFKIEKAAQTITVSSQADSIVAGKTAQITATAAGNVTFASDNTNVVKVDSTGKLTAVAPGTATITVSASATGNYKAATKTITIKVVPASTTVESLTNISSSAVTLSKSGYTYTGSAITPDVTVTYGGKKLAEGTDYTVTYSNNKEIGEGAITIAGEGNYVGTVKKTFKIVPASTTIKRLVNATKGITIKWNKVSEAGGYYIYRSKNGGKYSKIMSISSGKTVSYTDKSAKTNGAKYQYKIVSYKKVGKSTYEGASSKKKIIYRISAPKIKELSNKSGRKIAIKWTKNKKATGYQIQYATNSKFKNAKTVTVKKASAVSKVITKLKKNSTYRVRVRAYKTVSGKKYYSAWCSKKSVKVRK